MAYEFKNDHTIDPSRAGRCRDAHDPGYFLGKIGQPGLHVVSAGLGAGVDADLLAVLDADNLIILVKQASGCLGQADLEGNAVFEDEGITDLPVLFPALGIEAELAGRGEVIASDEGMSHTKEFQYHAPVIRLGDRMGTTKMDVLTAFQDCVEPMEHLRPSLPVPGGSQCAGSFKTLYEMFGSSDFGIVPGRTIFNHLIGPEGGATAVLQGWEAVENNIFRKMRLGT